MRSDSSRPSMRASTSTTGLATATSASRATSGVDVLVEAAARGPRTSRSAAPDSVFIAPVELADGRRIHQRHGETERNAERDRQHGQREPAAMTAERAAEHRARDGVHRACPRDLRSCSVNARSASAAAARECVTSMPRRAFACERDRAGARSRLRPRKDRGCRSARRRARSTGDARARVRSATRCNSPPESSRGMLAPRSPKPTASSIAATRSSLSRPVCASSASGSATFCDTVRYGSTWKAWNTKPTCRRRNSVSASSSSGARSCPATDTVPASA